MLTREQYAEALAIVERLVELGALQEHPAKIPHSHDPTKGGGMGHPTPVSVAGRARYAKLAKQAEKPKGRRKIIKQARRQLRNTAGIAAMTQATYVGVAKGLGAGPERQAALAKASRAAHKKRHAAGVARSLTRALDA